MKECSQEIRRISLVEAVEWRTPVWAPACEYALTQGAKLLAPNSKVLELGYNSGAMSCYLAQQYKWNMIGYEIKDEQQKKAQSLAQQLELEKTTKFLVCRPEDTFSIDTTFNGIFIKSFLYHNKSLADYIKWIEWLYQRLAPGGVLMAIENGQGHFFDRFYRNKIMKNCSWKDNIFFDEQIENKYRSLFGSIEVKYFGGVSQYLTSSQYLCHKAQSLEKIFFPSKASNCFIASLVARKQT